REVLAGAAQERGHGDSDLETIAVDRSLRRHGILRGRPPGDQRPDDVRKALQYVDPDRAVAGDAIADDTGERPRDLRVERDAGAARRGEVAQRRRAGGFEAAMLQAPEHGEKAARRGLEE